MVQKKSMETGILLKMNIVKMTNFTLVNLEILAIYERVIFIVTLLL